MSEVRLVVREAGRDWSGTTHGSDADRAIAALSADPVTMEELEAAAGRFAKRAPGRRHFVNLSPGRSAEPYDAGLVVIDLVARLVVVDSTYSSPTRKGSVRYHDGKSCTDIDLRYHLADDWLFERDGENWEYRAEELRRKKAHEPVLNTRGVFYGRPLLEFVGRQCFTAFARPGEPTLPMVEAGRERYDSPYYDQIKQIHAAWLLTPRDDLGGACPRAIALQRQQHIMWDLQDRCEQWSRLDECVPGVSESSDAFQNGGFGTHELVMYYNLVRHLLWSCWDQLGERASRSATKPWPGSILAGDLLTDEVPRLEHVRDVWLDTPDPEFHGRTPRSIMTRERARLPESMSRHEAMADPDCPCCQMIADLPGPSFWHLDGSGMDDEFAFDIRCGTREEWEKEQRDWEEYSKRFDAQWREREQLGVTDSTPCAEGPRAVWSRSFSVNGTADVPLGVRVFAFGGRLAELIVLLRAGADRDTTPPEAQRHIDRLNRDFGNLREVLQAADESLADALFDPVLDRFADTLDALSCDRADLVRQCESLTDELRTLLDPPAAEPASPF